MSAEISEEAAKIECFEIASELLANNPTGFESQFTRGRAVSTVALSTDEESGRFQVRKQVGSFDYFREVTWLFGEGDEMPIHDSSDGTGLDPKWRGLLSTMRMIKPAEGEVVDPDTNSKNSDGASDKEE